MATTDRADRARAMRAALRKYMDLYDNDREAATRAMEADIPGGVVLAIQLPGDPADAESEADVADMVGPARKALADQGASPDAFPEAPEKDAVDAGGGKSKTCQIIRKLKNSLAELESALEPEAE